MPTENISDVTPKLPKVFLQIVSFLNRLKCTNAENTNESTWQVVNEPSLDNTNDAPPISENRGENDLIEMVYVPPKSPEANGTTIQTSSANSHKTELIESIANREVGQNRLPQSSRSSSSSSSYSLRDSNAENPTHSEHNESPESLSGHEETNQQSTKSRKRKKNHLEWRRNLCKKLRNSGKEYKTLAKGTLVKKREILAPCNEKCRLKCTRKFTDENRSQIFTTFWNLEDLQKQRCFVLNSMRPIMPKYKKVRPEGGRERSCNKAYYFTINSVLTQNVSVTSVIPPVNLQNLSTI
ncbi:hypothetical protein Avbf_09406 [Armadillidium vulgare]|nr:hypothetical protein Avbf_09406 [Armadillidium vulgare]